MVGNEKAIEADIENVGQGHHLQKSLYLNYYATDPNQTFIKRMALRPTTTKTDIIRLWTVVQGNITEKQ